MQGLDEINGHSHGSLGYHYHGSRTYPYINGGMRGAVTVQNDQIEPQPGTQEVRPAGQPLPGAMITGSQMLGPASWKLDYTRSGALYSVKYRIESGQYVFDFVDASGSVRTERYSAGQTAAATQAPPAGAQGTPPPPPGGGGPATTEAPVPPASPTYPGFALSSSGS